MITCASWVRQAPGLVLYAWRSGRPPGVAGTVIGAHPTGVEFSLHLRLRGPTSDERDLHMELHAGRHAGPLSADALKFGLLFSDGRKWTSVESRSWRQHPPEPPAVTSLGGGGTPDSLTMRYWMWPLPPEGDLAIVSEWPGYDVPESRIVVDATELRARATEAEAIWPG